MCVSLCDLARIILTESYFENSPIKSGTKLSNNLFTKDTDFHQYLNATSCHSPYCKKSIPYEQAIRIKEACSDPN